MIANLLDWIGLERMCLKPVLSVLLTGQWCVFTVQVIDDTVGNTLCTASTLSKDIRESLIGSNGGNKVREFIADISCLLPENCYACSVLVCRMICSNPTTVGQQK